MRLAIVAAFSLAASALAADAPSLTVHEWGTFTSLQDESGNALGGLNSDEERLPEFAHDLAPGLITSEPVRYLSKGAPRADPDVTMRLETPVIYFHPANGWNGSVNVHVDFLGGWLTQFYPAANHPPANAESGAITPQTRSWLEWKSAAIGGAGKIPETVSPVWNAPRDVDSALVTTPEGEREKFLFYRGLGHLDSPLRVTRTSGGQLHIHTQLGFDSTGPQPFNDLWLAEFREGTCAFRVIDPLGGQPQSTSTSASFADSDFSAANLDLLRSSMVSALTREGLNPDEAAAVLNTWQLSYFKSGGTRLFYLVPRAWTDHFLPLQISGVKSSNITRVMIGRIEIISPQQRALLSKLSANPTPADYQALGRFRAALLRDEQKRRPNDTLQAFALQAGALGL